MKREIEEAIRTAVVEAGQDESLSRRLVSWSDRVSSGNEKLADSRRLEGLYDATILPEDAKRARIDTVLSEERKKQISEELFGSRAGPTGEDDSGRPANGRSSN